MRMALLLLGDTALFYAALLAALAIRSASFPDPAAFTDHIAPFSILIILWVVVFIIAGLYDQATVFSKKKLLSNLARTQSVNIVIAVFFFYLIPYFSITPKTNLFIYLIVSSFFILGWRLYIGRFLRRAELIRAVLVGSGAEAKELYETLGKNDYYGFHIIERLYPHKIEPKALARRIEESVLAGKANAVVVDMGHEQCREALPVLYRLLFRGVEVIDLDTLYESVFERIPLSLVRHQWFLEHLSQSSRPVYDTLKRSFDVIIALPLLVLFAVLFPFAAATVWVSDRGPVLYRHERVGRGGASITLFKFRSLRRNREGIWPGEGDNVPTRVGRVLRKTRLDELPQLWNVVRGDLSLIGPRPDTVGIAERVRKEVPYYDARYLITPGLSGWAQIKQETQPQSIEEMKVRLSYDLYYVKNRSFILDLVIALRTVKTLLSRTGR